MTSEKISALADHFAKYQDTGMTLQPEAVATVCAVLISLADDVGAMERAQGPVSAEVIPLRPRRRPASMPSGGGDNAA
jgi:hypothetical protein